MSSKSGPIYEVTFFVEPDIADECDSWLEDHVRKVMHEPGVVDCNIFSLGNDEQGRARRVVQHLLQNNEALDDFLEGAGTDIEGQLETRFGDQVALSSRVLREDRSPATIPGSSTDCLNCGTHLRGQYCGSCGQRSRGRLISLWELLTDAFGDLLEIDSRLWQTLIPMMVRPGRLTHDYLQGRRARYMPPFRMYLVLSVLFFVVAFFEPREQLGLLFEPEPELTTEEATSDALDQKQAILDELAADGIVIGSELTEEIEALEDVGEEFNAGFRIDTDEDGDCEVDVTDLEDLPDWLARRLTVERLQRICERTQIDGGKAFLDKLLDNVPAALIILLPLMALVLKALYPLSKRYYVEHLLFFVHFHAFFFLILSLQILFMRLSALLQIPETIAIITVVIASFYVPAYLFVAMRRVYGQGRIITFIKYIALVISYCLGFFATMLGAVAIAAFSI